MIKNTNQPNIKIINSHEQEYKKRNNKILNEFVPIDYLTELEIKWPYTSIVYCPLSDLHAGNYQCRMEAFNKWLNFMENTYNAVSILNGDIFDYATQNSISNTHDENLPPEQVLDYLVDKFSTLAKQGKIIAITPGNHDSKNSKRGVDTNIAIIKILADRLQVPYCEHNVIASFKMPLESAKQTYNFRIAAMHGAKKAGGVAGALDVGKKQIETALKTYNKRIDILDFGHFHQGGNLYCRYEIPEKDGNSKITQTTTEESLFISNYSFQDNSDYGAEENLGSANVNSWIVYAKPGKNIFYKSNEHENNKIVLEPELTKMFKNNTLEYAQPAQIIMEKYHDSYNELLQQIKQEFKDKTITEMLNTIEKGGLTK